MELEQIKTEIVADLRHQLFRKACHKNWTSQAWYFSSIYCTHPNLTAQAIEQLIAEGKIKRSKRSSSGKTFTVLELIPND